VTARAGPSAPADDDIPISVGPETERTNVMALPPSGMPVATYDGRRGPSSQDDADPHCGRYRLCFELASGGMASVFLARQDGPAGFDRLVAVKRVHRWLVDEDEFIEMFLDEARIAASITHPNVCSVLDFGESRGALYLAMEYMMGEPLASIRDILAQHPEMMQGSLAYVIRIVADAAEGLHAAHELCDDAGQPLNVVHRDVCPSNLFVTYDGNTKVVDFGIARAAGRIHKTATGVVKGHIPYMAPEQLAGEALDRRADVWALGVVLWELVAGQRLFHHTTAVQTIRAIANGPIPKLSRIRRGVPEALDALVARALCRDVRSRYPTAREMGRALTRFAFAHCEPTGLAEIAEWMDAIFKERREQKIEMVRRAKRM
jgi:serine/threonine-protein kinase